ncbi:MAG: hypothetical protein AAF939_06765 [Planctomycetota bacterium]
MAAYVLTNRNTKELETTIFSSEAGDAVAVFTDPKHAQKYLDDADWNESMTVATLESVELIEWLMHCYRNGVRLLATDPKRSEQDSGMRLSTLDIEAQLEHAGNHIIRTANPEF